MKRLFLDVYADERSAADGGLWKTEIYRIWSPRSRASSIISSGHREHWTSPICALRRRNIQILD